MSPARRQPRYLRPLVALALLGLPALSLTGCGDGGRLELRREIGDLETRLAACERDLSAEQARNKQLAVQLASARGFTDDELRFLFHPVELKFASLTGGQDYDGTPGDDGVTVYLRPIDQDGDIVKAAGSIRIELFDLSRAPGQTLIGSYDFPVERARDLWFDDFGTRHYSLKCPWRGPPPATPELTVRAVFTDFLTKRVITAQEVVPVR